MKKILLLAFVISIQLLRAQVPPICFDTTDYAYTLPNGGGLDLVSEDFNGDSLPDIAVCLLGADRVILMTGNGNGSFNAPSPAVFATGSYPQNLLAGDFNNDNRMDVITVNSFSNSISLLLGTGTGSFLPQAAFAVGTFPKSLTKGDFNNDGNLDVAVSNYSSGNIYVLLGTGTGSFQPGILLPTLVGAEAVTCGDYNNDGNPDLAVCIWTSAFIHVFFGNGNGTFQTALNCPMSYMFDNYAEAITSGDVNNDSYQDIIVHDDLSNTLTLFLGTASFSMAPAVAVGVTTGNGNIHTMAAADINGDGNADLVTPETNILLGLGNGSFLAPVSFTTFSGASVIVKDLNKDGKPDLAFGIGQLSIVLNDPLLSLAGLPPFICAGHTLTLSVSGASSYAWSTGQTGSVVAVSPAATTGYTVTGSSSTGCVNKVAFTVSVTASPDSAALAFMSLSPALPGTVCAGDQVSICVSGATGYTWSTGSTASCISPTPSVGTTYSVLASGNGCYKAMRYTQEVAVCTGLKEQAGGGAQLSVYPNPSPGPVQLEASAALDFLLLNPLGDILLRATLPAGRQTLYLSAYPAGIYLLLVTDQDQHTETKKIILQP